MAARRRRSSLVSAAAVVPTVRKRRTSKRRGKGSAPALKLKSTFSFAGTRPGVKPWERLATAEAENDERGDHEEREDARARRSPAPAHLARTPRRLAADVVAAT